MSVGNILRKIREENGLTQGQFADKIGVKRTTYISYENSKTNPEFSLIKKIAKIFDVSIVEFLEEEERPRMSELNAPEVVYNAGSERKDTVLSSEEKLLVMYFRSLDGKEKEEFFKEIKNDYLDRKCSTNEE